MLNKCIFKNNQENIYIQYIKITYWINLMEKYIINVKINPELVCSGNIRMRKSNFSCYLLAFRTFLFFFFDKKSL